MNPQVTIHPPSPEDEGEFLAAVARSSRLFAQWVSPPATAEAFANFLKRAEGERHQSYLVRAGNELAGCVNLSEIVAGAFRSAYLGYYAFEPHQGKGVMKQGLARVITTAFQDLELHRLEANIQPENTASIRLVTALGFRHEGFSPRYLHIAGQWRDHDRFAITSEEWTVPTC